MVRKTRILHYSLFIGAIGALVGGDSYSAVRIGNATRNNFYEQQMVEQQRIASMQQQVASVNDVARMSGIDADVTASDLKPGEEHQLEMCSQIYPNGEFALARPTAGLGAGGAKTCVAVVELRGYQMGQNGTDAVLARANVAAGSTIKCNISDFPESSYTLDAQNVLFPADAEPTTEDVKKVMNQEQKQNAGLKIAAAALIGGIGGNISGKNDAGKDGIFGTSKSKITNTVVGAVGGAAIGAAGSYSGYEAGNMIMSAGINAAAGGIVGNIMAAGDSVLRIEKCTDSNGASTSCLWGYLVTGPNLVPDASATPGVLCKEKTNECYKYYIDLDDGETVMRCGVDDSKCSTVSNLVSIRVGGKGLEGLERKDLDALKSLGNVFMVITDKDKNKTMEVGMDETISHTYRPIDSAKMDAGPKQPVLIVGFEDSAFGRKSDYWRNWKVANENVSIYFRNGDGNPGEDLRAKDPSITLENFYPMYVDASDGGIVDLGNKARLKSTVIGAGVGGAVGAFTAYQGAQSDIDERWVAAVREYKDSLQKFYCVTGSRFLSYYNDVVFIPDANK
ncbi:MAG: hypothetical protein IKP05_01850 [Alphaproteobacteria bacterium]|nr:hypothetical protein [Alphaproteobacteria bacterium]